jgi:hypothetical protein
MVAGLTPPRHGRKLLARSSRAWTNRHQSKQLGPALPQPRGLCVGLAMMGLGNRVGRSQQGDGKLSHVWLRRYQFRRSSQRHSSRLSEHMSVGLLPPPNLPSLSIKMTLFRSARYADVSKCSLIHCQTKYSKHCTSSLRTRHRGILERSLARTGHTQLPGNAS